MARYLPDNKDWFQEAEQAIRQETTRVHTPPNTSPMKALLPDGNDGSMNFNDQVEGMVVRPSSIVNLQTIWDSIKGNQQAKEIMHATMVRRLYRGKRVNNILLFGPPGTGKTMMLTCAATMAEWTVLYVTQLSIMQTYQGQPEK